MAAETLVELATSGFCAGIMPEAYKEGCAYNAVCNDVFLDSCDMSCF